MGQLTQDLPGVAVYLDDILVSGNNAEQHLQNLKRLLQRSQAKGLCCRLEKCAFAQPYVRYLGHYLSKNGIAKGPKADAVKKMPAPTNVPSLRSFMGQVQFYRKFLSSLPTILEPLYHLIKKDVPWRWGKTGQDTFQRVKNLLSANTMLAHFNPALEEALAVTFGLNKFHQFPLGRRFILVTDHKQLIALFRPTKPTPALAANRLATWALTLSQYDYTIEYLKTSTHGNADVLSRLPAGADPSFDRRTGQEFSDLDKLAEAADRVWEARSSGIQHITPTTLIASSLSSVTGPLTRLKHIYQGKHLSCFIKEFTGPYQQLPLLEGSGQGSSKLEKKPHLLIADKFRHQLSTIFASFELPKEQQNSFIRHMRHSEAINRNVYQCTMAIQEITRVGKILSNIDSNASNLRREAAHDMANTEGKRQSLSVCEALGTLGDRLIDSFIH
ncbi:transposon Tf2-6 polyprotein [Elysia marginata]|uniref:Transposon Tf2-6 polyprotein n=1 Tax=Elysia marginata TaxID=1093978 RepID=A0AAV4HT76_9GAST|nr:transposon Tf2-6 polyprotein [Elysia marginata]